MDRSPAETPRVCGAVVVAVGKGRVVGVALVDDRVGVDLDAVAVTGHLVADDLVLDELRIVEDEELVGAIGMTTACSTME